MFSVHVQCCWSDLTLLEDMVSFPADSCSYRSSAFTCVFTLGLTGTQRRFKIMKQTFSGILTVGNIQATTRTSELYLNTPSSSASTIVVREV